MKFYEFSQNNSGGSFDVDDKLCHRLFIEADNAKEANRIAEGLGCYWNGCSSGIDCNCCGDRWSEAWGDDSYINIEQYRTEGYRVGVYESTYSNDSPEKRWSDKYGKYQILEKPKWKKGNLFRQYEGKISFSNIEEYAQFLTDQYGSTSPDARIFYKDGTVKEIFKTS